LFNIFEESFIVVALSLQGKCSYNNQACDVISINFGLGSSLVSHNVPVLEVYNKESWMTNVDEMNPIDA